MKLDKLLSVQAVVEGRKVPIDILENGYTHYSKSRDEYIDLLDLDLIHFIRIHLKLVDDYNKKVHRFNKESIDEMQYTLNQMYEDLQTLKKDNGLDDVLSETERKKLNG